MTLDPETRTRAATSLSEKGFVVVPEVLEVASLGKYKAALEKAIAAQDGQWSASPYYIDRGMVHNPMIHDEIFMDYLRNEKVNDYLEELFDRNCILYAFTTSSMPPSESNFSHRIHVDCPRLIEDYPTNMGFLVALDDFTADNGATYFLPGSHRLANQPSEEVFFRDSERVMLKAGDGVMFNARTWHMGGRNATNQYRHALTINVCRPYMRQRFDYPRLLGEDKVGVWDERLLRFLGYRVRIPVTLDQYYVPPEQRLYWGGQG